MRTPKRDTDNKRSSSKDQTVAVLCTSMTDAVHVHRRLLCDASNQLNQKVKVARAGIDGSPRIDIRNSDEAFEFLRRWLYGEPIYQQDVT